MNEYIFVFEVKDVTVEPAILGNALRSGGKEEDTEHDPLSGWGLVALCTLTLFVVLLLANGYDG